MFSLKSNMFSCLIVITMILILPDSIIGTYFNDGYYPHHYMRPIYLDNHMCYASSQTKEGKCMASIRHCPANRGPEDLKAIRQILCGFTFDESIQPEPEDMNEGKQAELNELAEMVPLEPDWHSDIADMEYYAFPWLAAIMDEENKFICAGALVSKNAIVTSASCGDGGKKVRLGQQRWSYYGWMGRGYGYGHNYGDHNENSNNMFEVTGFEAHPEYNADTHENDVAVMMLDKEVDTRMHYPLRLPKNMNDQHLENYWVTQVGWGHSGHSRSQPYLRSITSTSMDNEVCRRLLNWDRDQLKPSHLCVDDPFGMCVSDKGGPLITLDHGRWTLIGTMTFGRHCFTSGMPIIFSRLTAVEEWLKGKFDEQQAAKEP